MRAAPTWRVDRGAWKLYLGAGLVALIGIAQLVLGNPAMAIVAWTLAVWIGAHPYMRRTWFEVGYGWGYDEGADDVMRSFIEGDR